MVDATHNTAQSPRCDVAIFFDGELLQRFRPIIRHLSVGLIDLVGRVQLVSPDREIERLALGPVTTLTYTPPNRFNRRRAADRLIERMSTTPPTVMHAISAGGFEFAAQAAAAFDADLAYQVSALDDIDALATVDAAARFAVVCSSQPLLDRYRELNLPGEHETRIIRPGVSCRDTPTCFVDESRDPTLISTSALVESEGVHALIEATRLLADRGHRFLLFLLGAGPMERSLRRTVHRLELDSIVVFAQPSGDVLEAMVGADIFIHPACGKTISARSIQALGQGAAVVSVRGGVLDALIADRTAILCDTGTPRDLAAAIERLLLDHELARRLAQGAIDHMRENHSMSRMAELTAELYQDMLMQHATFRMQRDHTRTT